MDLIEFGNKMKKAVLKELGEDTQVEFKTVRKNNDQELYGMLIRENQRVAVPTFYLDGYFQEYKKGTPFKQIFEKLMEIYRSTPKEDVDLSFFEVYDKVKDRICYRLINLEENREYLEDLPYVQYLNLAICFYYAFNSEALGEGSIMIHHSFMERWGVTVEELLKQAEENTCRLYPPYLESVEKLVIESLGLERLPVKNDVIPLDVLSNNKRDFGAISILYPGMLKLYAKRCGGNFFIIPSSVHEVLLMRDTGEENPENFKQMIAEVNDFHLPKEEFLSNDLYYYDSAEETVLVL